MKKLLVLLAAFMLLSSSLLTEVKAEAKIESATPMGDDYYYFSHATNCYYKSVKGGYQVFSIDGKPLSSIYGNLDAVENGMYYKYYSDSGINKIGLLDRNGKVLVKPSYGQIEVDYSNDAWVLGYVLELTSNAVGDFKNQNNQQFMVVRTDVLYEGRVIGSLSRKEFNPSLSHGTVGNYFYVRTTSDAGYFIDKNFNITRVEKDMTWYSEFTEQYKKGMFHNPTQQWAFCDTCTLTEEDVSYSIWYNDQTDCLLDLQGNVIKSEVVVDSARTKGDYIVYQMNGKDGVMDNQGNIIIKANYDEICGTPFENKYQAAITEDGNLHYYDRQGNLTAKVEYQLNSYDYRGADSNSSFAIVKNMNKFIAITAVKGELPGVYSDYYSPRTTHQLLLLKKDGYWGAIDINGNTVLPFNYKSLSQTYDSTVVYGRDKDNNDILYRFSFTEDAAKPQLKGSEPKQSDAAAADENAQNSGAWICVCGATATGKFCPECGKPKPDTTSAPGANDAWVCTCGANNTSKFCPQCGAAKPVELQCTNCGYKPEGTAPKFCPECGNKF